MGLLAAIAASPPSGEGVWAAAFVAVLTAIAGGSWKLLSDSSDRVDESGREQRDRLQAELDRTRADLTAARDDARYWRELYLRDRQDPL